MSDIFSTQKMQRQSQVLSYLIRNGEASRKEIAEKLLVTPATLTRISSELLEYGIIFEKGTQETGRVGRREINLDIKGDCKYALGMDVANTYIMVNLLNLKLEIVETKRWDFELLTQEILNEAIQTLKSYIAWHGGKKILGLGLLVQGYVENDLCMSLPIKNIKQQLESEIEINIIMQNNIHGLAVTQSFLEETNNSFLMLHYGPGIASVVVIDGVIVSGYHNQAGEIGHVLWNAESNTKCNVCGKTGCLESILHFDNLVRSIDFNATAVNTSYEELQIFSQRDDHKTVKNALYELARVAILLIKVIDPQHLFLGGEIFADPMMMDVFTDYLSERNGEYLPEFIMRMDNYSKKRKLSPGIVVLNEYFGNEPSRSFFDIETD